MEKNKIELLTEEIECVHLYLDELNIPRSDVDGTYSIVGRIKKLLKVSKPHKELLQKLADALTDELQPSINNGLSTYMTRTNSHKVLAEYKKFNAEDNG